MTAAGITGIDLGMNLFGVENTPVNRIVAKCLQPGAKTFSRISAESLRAFQRMGNYLVRVGNRILKTRNSLLDPRWIQHRRQVNRVLGQPLLGALKIVIDRRYPAVTIGIPGENQIRAGRK